MSSFVGRTREVDYLLSRLDRTQSGRGGVVFITGDAGAGKSTLVEHFLVEAALRAPDAHILVGTCSEQYGAGEPYQPFIEAFRALLTEGKKKEGSRGRFHELARSLAPAWVQVIPVAGDVLAAAIETAVEVQRFRSGSTATEVAASEEALFFQYTELLLAAAEEAPVIMFLDDLHWADRASVSLFAHLARKIADRRVLILGTYRQADVAVSKHPILEARSELKRYSLSEDLELEALDEAALAEFVRDELGGPGTPKLRRWLAERAGPNPLFFGELLRWLVEQGYCVERDGEWGLTTIPDQIEVPSSAEGVIEKRLGRLDEEVRRILEYASVQGDEFDSTILARLLEVDDLELEETLERLARVDQLIKLTDTKDLPDGDISSVYLFSHSLIQDVLHRELQGKRRILLHRKVAGILEELYAADTSGVDHMLAVHFEEGRQPDRAYEAALRAAERARRLYAHQDAVQLLSLALRNASDDRQRAEVLDLRAVERRDAGGYAEALEDVNEALGVIDASEDRALSLRLRRRRLVLEAKCGLRPPGELIASVAELAAEARQSGERGELCEILSSVRVLPRVKPDDAALSVSEALHEALAVAEALEREDLVARAHYSLGTGPMQKSDPRQALEHLERASERYENMEDRQNVAYCLNARGVVRVLLGEYNLSREEFVRAEAIFDEKGDPVSSASVRNNLGILLTRLGRFDEAEEALLSALDTTRRLGIGGWELAPLEALGRLYTELGDVDRAATHWEELAARAEQLGYRDQGILARCELGYLSLRKGDREAARSALEEAVDSLGGDSEGWSDARQSILFLTVHLALEEDRRAEAALAASEAEAAFESRDEYVWATFRLLRAEAVHGTDPDATRVAREALSTFEKLEAAPSIKRAAALLARMEAES